jgi:hypothetical protein
MVLFYVNVELRFVLLLQGVLTSSLCMVDAI